VLVIVRERADLIGLHLLQCSDLLNDDTRLRHVALRNPSLRGRWLNVCIIKLFSWGLNQESLHLQEVFCCLIYEHRVQL
jgi:hypothetical protein